MPGQKHSKMYVSMGGGRGGNPVAVFPTAGGLLVEGVPVQTDYPS